MSELHELSAETLLRGLVARTFSTLDLAEDLLRRADTLNELNAFCALDADEVRRQARQADALRRSPGHPPELTGLPVTFKDNIAVAGQTCSAGTPALRSFRPKANAPIAERILGKGAISFGRTGMHELALGVTCNNPAVGPIRNPFDPGRICGGSSGGTACAVAARLAPIGIGTDTGGSVRIPAALCGLYGFRPSLGRWSAAGIVPISHNRDTPGPIARAMGDIVLMDTVATDQRDPPARIRPADIRLGLPDAGFWAPLDEETARLCRAALEDMKALGVEIVEVDTREIVALANELAFLITLHDCRSDLREFLAGLPVPVAFEDLVRLIASPDVKATIEALVAPPADEAGARYVDAVTRRLPELRRRYQALFDRYRLNALVFPTVPLPAPRVGEDDTIRLAGRDGPVFETIIRNTDPGACTGLPGLTLPCGLTRDGLPVGLAFDGPYGRDRELLGLGLALQELFPAAAAALATPVPGRAARTQA